VANETKIDIEIPGHRILRQLGSGGMANVYLAFQESMEREVALKLMHPSLGLTDPAFSERFVREAKIIAKLSHPHVNAVYDVGVAGSYHYFTMEYITGGDLKSRIRKGMPPKAAFAIARQIASALAFAHSKGYVHRDVKPENVLFRDSGTAVLTDFGIAKTNDNSMTATGSIVGTPYYMSPEQAMGRETDKRSDLYSLGAMIFEMLTGKVPYTGDSAVSIGIKHLRDAVPPLPPPLQVYQPLLEKFLAKNPAHRFQTGEEAIASIDAVTSGANTLAPAAGPPHLERTIILGPKTAQAIVTSAGQTKRRGLLVATTLLVPLVVGAAFLALRKPAEPTATTTAPVPTVVESTTASTRADAAAAQIAQLLAQADDAVREARYLDPVETAAVPKLRRVLVLDPSNSRAARSLNEIAGRFIAQAERAIEQKSFDQAETFLKNAEEADSSHPMLFSRRLALNELRQKRAAAIRVERKAEVVVAPRSLRTRPAAVEAPKQMLAPVEDPRARESRERELKLQSLLARFRELLAPSSLSAARAALAQDLMSEATRLAPDDSRVRALPGQLADTYLRLARTKAEEKEYQEAGGLIQRGLELQPDHRQLLALQRDVTEKKNPKRQTFGSF
jgi:tetratricopeptide (TPR) repeat protein